MSARVVAGAVVSARVAVGTVVPVSVAAGNRHGMSAGMVAGIAFRHPIGDHSADRSTSTGWTGRGRDGRGVAVAGGPRRRPARQAAGLVAAVPAAAAQLHADLAGKAVHGLTGG